MIGLEPTASAFAGLRSIQLSYTDWRKERESNSQGRLTHPNRFQGGLLHQWLSFLEETVGFEPTRPRGLFAFEASAFNRTQPHLLADTVGFEPTWAFTLHAFQACPLSHSGKCPGDSERI